ncbi:MAG: S41 family peptidase [Parachlamydiaceae bacterium]|nr:S41 family peptidase [Parachlamydiaceae bacterium]
MFGEATLPDICPIETRKKAEEILGSHARYKELNPLLVQRTLNNFIDSLDPAKTYFLEPEIHPWLEAKETLLQQILDAYHKNDFSVFEQIHEKFRKAIERKQGLEKEIEDMDLPGDVQPDEFKEMNWLNNEEELKTKLIRIRALQLNTISKLNSEMQERSLRWLVKRKVKRENEHLNPNLEERQKFILSLVLKSIANALDSHTFYYTPLEASQIKIEVQQRLFGIGAQLRDDVSGLRVTKLIDGGPALLGKQLKVKDLIIAVNGEPIVGMDIEDSVSMIRGEVNTPVILTILRNIEDKDGTKKEEKLEITILRGEVVLKEYRYKSDYECFGHGVIGYLKLFAFYQDNDYSSAKDLENEIRKLKEDHRLLGLILDLRYNSGGLLYQAVNVSSLFMSKGIVVSIKDEDGEIQHLRNLDGTVIWDGPLIILVNRLSASASEIVAQTLQDYGCGLVVGDDHTFGKGSYQVLTLATHNDKEPVNSKGEFKVTRGCYYTPSGETPQLNGVQSSICVPGLLSESEVGEKFAKFPLESDKIKPNFVDDLSDVPLLKREKLRKFYQYGVQERMQTYTPYIEKLKENSSHRIESHQNYQNFLKEIRKKDRSDDAIIENFGSIDLQLDEAYAIMKDLLIMMKEDGLLQTSKK